MLPQPAPDSTSYPDTGPLSPHLFPPLTMQAIVALVDVASRALAAAATADPSDAARAGGLAAEYLRHVEVRRPRGEFVYQRGQQGGEETGRRPGGRASLAFGWWWGHTALGMPLTRPDSPFPSQTRCSFPACPQTAHGLLAREIQRAEDARAAAAAAAVAVAAAAVPAGGGGGASAGTQ
jgi:hypothetical protein